nr:hypothetical protein [Thermobacillus xylanilyticus]
MENIRYRLDIYRKEPAGYFPPVDMNFEYDSALLFSLILSQLFDGLGYLLHECFKIIALVFKSFAKAGQKVDCQRHGKTIIGDHLNPKIGSFHSQSTPFEAGAGSKSLPARCDSVLINPLRRIYSNHVVDGTILSGGIICANKVAAGRCDKKTHLRGTASVKHDRHSATFIFHELANFIRFLRLENSENDFRTIPANRCPRNSATRIQTVSIFGIGLSRSTRARATRPVNVGKVLRLAGIRFVEVQTIAADCPLDLTGRRSGIQNAREGSKIRKNKVNGQS